MTKTHLTIERSPLSAFLILSKQCWTLLIKKRASWLGWKASFVAPLPTYWLIESWTTTKKYSRYFTRSPATRSRPKCGRPLNSSITYVIKFQISFSEFYDWKIRFNLGFQRRWVWFLYRNDAMPAQLSCERHAGVPFQSAKPRNRLFHVLQGFNLRLRWGPRKSRSQATGVHCHPVQKPGHRESRNLDKDSCTSSRATNQGNQDAWAPPDVSPGTLKALFCLINYAAGCGFGDATQSGTCAAFAERDPLSELTWADWCRAVRP